jgi:hypothetical protein
MSIDTLGIRPEPALHDLGDDRRRGVARGSVEDCVIDGDRFYRLAHVDRFEPFFMSLLSAEDHWAFISSTGAISCGRRNPQGSVFPYYPSDTLLSLRESTGPLTVLHVGREGRWVRWEPLRRQEVATGAERYLAKNRLGSRVIFEERHDAVGLAFRSAWSLAPRFGFVRTVQLENLDPHDKEIELLDGFRDIMPWGIDPRFQLRFSNLADAYRQSELLEPQGIGVFSLTAVPTDRPEPSEGLMASVAWSSGFAEPTVLLSDRQLAAFRQRRGVSREVDVRGRKGHYLVAASFTLPGRGCRVWRTVVDARHDACDLTALARMLQSTADLDRMVDDDVARGEEALRRYASNADGMQACRDGCRTGRHLSNVLFNIMRGGVPVADASIARDGFLEHLRVRNPGVHDRHAARLQALPPTIPMDELSAIARASADPDLIRLAAEFLPLTLGRRHGDPTRPWNSFDITPRTPQGERRVGYEGNWRDIFQNWEALAFSHPQLLPGMILRFVNSSTADGYNPYRISETGFEWERPEPDDPWANFGYWGDHQIVYLWKLLEQAQALVPRRLAVLLAADAPCVYADSPYRIRDFRALVRSPRETIEFDAEAERSILGRVAAAGTDGLLVRDRHDRVQRVSLLEKLLVGACVKLCNFVPDAGIWLNTQRPEWNDAQNGLAGLGASLVTTCYLRGYLVFLAGRLEELPVEGVLLSAEVAVLVERLGATLAGCVQDAGREPSDRRRHDVVERLQQAAEAHRRAVYGGFTGDRTRVSRACLTGLVAAAIDVLTQTLRRSRRPDGLYHSFTLLDFAVDAIRVEPLEEMLEGQVAILESGMLSPADAGGLLAALRSSRLYRSDQSSYLLYPDRVLPRFLQKNRIPARRAAGSPVVQRVLQSGFPGLLRRDVDGAVHFSGTLRNVGELHAAITAWNRRHPSAALAAADREELGLVWEETFSHRGYTGRATRFCAYEGLGSVYWHMVSKLAHAAARQCILAAETGDPAFADLVERFREINEGMWLEKPARVYGAFPTDPYSHTPAHAGAQQPGMTGQVKEDILTRFLELGVRVRDGRLRFDPCLLRPTEFLDSPGTLQVHTIAGGVERLPVPAGALAFTVCQVPVVYSRTAGAPPLRIVRADGSVEVRETAELTADESQELFMRTGSIVRIDVTWEAWS